MLRINHNDAIELEYIVRKVYGCERAGVAGMCDADYFNNKPIQAAVLVISYLYANGLITGTYEYEEFIHQYETIFDYPDEYDIKTEVENYISDLKSIVNKYLG
jgi:hypothetical protein